MNDTVSIAFTSQYSDQLYDLVEQQGSRLLNTVSSKIITNAEDAYFERLGSSGVAQERIGRHSLSEPSDIEHSRRVMRIRDFYVEHWLDKHDQLRMLIDPKNKYVMKQSYSLGRKIDQRIVTMATGNSTAVDAVYGTSNVALPSGQYGSKDTGGTNSGLNVDKLLEAQRIYDQNDCAESAKRTCVVAAKDKESLLKTTEVGSQDYNNVYALVSGKINSFCGFDFVLYNSLSGAGTSGDPRLVLTYEKEAMGVAFLRNIVSRIFEDEQRFFMWRVQSEMSMEAIRVEEERVVVIKTVD